MEFDEALTAFAALSTKSRVEVLRLLAPKGDEGLPSGKIAEALEVPTNTLSTQLLLLSNARLVRSRREGRQIFYSINLETMEKITKFLFNECAGGRLKASVKKSEKAA